MCIRDRRNAFNHTVKLGKPARMVVGIAFDQTAAADDLDRRILVAFQIARRPRQPRLLMRDLLRVAQ